MTLTSTAPATRAPAKRPGSAESTVLALLDEAGITIGGTARHDITVHEERLNGRVLRDGSLGLGETCIDGWRDAPAVDELIAAVIAADLPRKVGRNWKYALAARTAKVFNLQSRHRAPQVAEQHCDVGNDLYRVMLDPRMVNSCA